MLELSGMSLCTEANPEGYIATAVIGLHRGKKLYDRRREIAERDSRRDMARELADVTRGR